MAFYIPVLNSAETGLFMMKATVASPGDSDWASIGGSISFTNAVKSLHAEELSSDIHVITQEETTGRFSYHIFDPGTDTWTTSDETGGAPDSTAGWEDAPDKPSVSFKFRADGDLVLAVAYNTSTAPQLRWWARESGTWDNKGRIDHDGTGEFYGANVIGPDSSDIITCVLTAADFDDIDLSTITGANSVEDSNTATDIDTAADTSDFSCGPGVIVSDVIYAPYIDASGKVSVASWTSEIASTLTPENPHASPLADVSEIVVSYNTATTPPYPPHCLVLDGTAVHLLYSEDTTKDLIHNDDATTAAGGGTETELEAGTCNRISGRKGTTNILYVWDDGGTTKFGIIAAGATAQAIAALATGTAALVKKTGKPLAATVTGTAALTKKMFETLAATATGTALLTASLKFFATLAATVTGTANLLLLRRKLLVSTVTATALLVKKTGKTLAATATGIAVIQKRFFEVLAATGTGTAILLRKMTFKRTLPATATGTATLTLIRAFKRLLSATAAGTAVLSAISAGLTQIALAATATASALLVKKVGKPLAASTTGTAILTKRMFRTLAAIATGTAALTLVRAFKRLLGATATGTAGLTLVKAFKRLLAATATGAAVLSSVAAGVTQVILAALATVSATLSTRAKYVRLLSATATGTALLTAVGSVIAGAFNYILLRRRRRDTVVRFRRSRGRGKR